MKKKLTVLTLCAVLFALCYSAWAQQPKKIPRIGFLGASSPSAISARLEAFRQGLMFETCGSRDSVLKFLPPLNIDTSLLDHGLDLVEQAMASVLAEPALVAVRGN